MASLLCPGFMLCGADTGVKIFSAVRIAAVMNGRIVDACGNEWVRCGSIYGDERTHCGYMASNERIVDGNGK